MSDGPHRTEIHSVPDLDENEFVEYVTENLLTCLDCEEVNEEPEEINKMSVKGTLLLQFVYDCEYCGTYNENTAELEAV